MRSISTGILLSLIISSNCIGQNISLNDLFVVCNKTNWTEVNTLVTKKGWEYYESKEGDSEHYNTIVWSFNKSDYSDRAQGWLNLHTVNNVPQKIKCDFFNKQAYESFQKAVSALRLNQVNSIIKDDYIQTQYSNSQFYITIKISKIEKNESFEEVSMPGYSIEVTKKNGAYDEYNGVKTTYYEDGTLKNEYTLKNGSVNGLAKSFYPNGKLKTTAFFIDNNRNGIERTYDEDGVLTHEYNYINGIGNGIYKIYRSGKIRQIGSLKKDIHDGIFKNYDEQGNIVKEFTMKDGLLHGSFKEMFYNEHTVILEQRGQYENGKEVGRWEIFKLSPEKRPDLLEYIQYVNGIKFGAFKEVKSDSIIFGSYDDDELSGPYYVYTKLSYFLNGKVSGDTTNCPLTIAGSFNSGLKDGQWKYFDFTGNLSREGVYKDDLENGEWKYYFPKMIGNMGDENFSRMMYLTKQYKHGKLDGKTIQLAYQEKYKTLCDSTEIILSNGSDSCLRLRQKKIYDLQTYKNGILSGPSELRDSLDTVISKGEYKDGLKNGGWIQRVLYRDINNEKYYRRFEGRYLLGKKEGIWKEYKGDRLISETEFSGNQRHGNAFNYDWGNTEFITHTYNRGVLTKLVVYNSTTKDTMQVYQIKNVSEKLIQYKLVHFERGVKRSSREYNFIKDSDVPINIYSLVQFHELRSYTDGRFEEYDERGRMVEEGSQCRDKKIKLYRFYDYDQKIIVEKDFQANGTLDAPVEYFYSLDSRKPFNGTLTRKHSNGKLMYEIRIKEGLREGKSKMFDQDGKISKVEKYKMGLVVN